MKSNSSKWIVGLIVLVILVVLAVAQKKTALQGTYNIGVLESLTGSASYYGQSTKKGVDLTAGEAKDKYPGIIFNIFHEDHQFNPRLAVDAYTKLRAEQSIDAVITQTSPAAMAVKPAAARDNILQMAVSASASGYSSPDDLSFRTTGDSVSETKVIADYIKNTYSRTALLGMNNEIGLSSIQGIEGQLKERNIPVVFKEMYAVDSTDYRTYILKLKKENLDNVYMAGLASHIATFLKQAQELGVSIKVITFRTGEDPSLITNAGVLAEGVIFTSGFDPSSSDPEIQKFISLYREQYGADPDTYAAESYLGTHLVFESFSKCGRDTKCIFSYLSTLKDYPSPLGRITFDESGNITYPFFLKTVRDGKFVKLD